MADNNTKVRSSDSSTKGKKKKRPTPRSSGTTLALKETSSRENTTIQSMDVFHPGVTNSVVETTDFADDENSLDEVSIAVPVASQQSFAGAGERVLRMVSMTKRMFSIDTDFDMYNLDTYGQVTFPRDLPILPIYQEILDEPLPSMAVFPIFHVNEEQIEETIKEMHYRIARSPSYKTFLEETKNLLTYCLQERRLRKTMQDNLKFREEEMRDLVDKHKHDPRVPRIIQLADNWRQENLDSEQKILTITSEMNSVMIDMKGMENKMKSMAKKQAKMEQMLNKSRHCELEKEKLEEQLMYRDQGIADRNEQIETLNTTVTQMETAANRMSADFKAKLEAAPDRSAAKLAWVTRELEMITLEKEFKQQEARDLHDHVNMLMLENSRCTDRVKMLRIAQRQLAKQTRTLETNHTALVSQNRGLQRQLDKSHEDMKWKETGNAILGKENTVLKEKMARLKAQLKTEEERYVVASQRISTLQIEVASLEAKLHETTFTHFLLKREQNEAKEKVENAENHIIKVKRTQQDETQKVSLLQRKLKASGKHIQTALQNAHVMSGQMDKATEKLRLLERQMSKCHTENSRNDSIFKYMKGLLENSEDMYRLQASDNDALILSEAKLLKALKQCQMCRKELSNDVAKLMSVNSKLEDSANVHQFMMDFVEAERDAAIRLNRSRENAIVIMRRDQLSKFAALNTAMSDLSKMKMNVNDLHVQFAAQKKEIHSLNTALQKADDKYSQIEYWCKNLLHQRDTFGTKLLQNNTEAELMKMKMDTMEQMLDLANSVSWQKSNDLTVLKKEIDRLRKRVNGLKNVEATCQELRTELIYYSKNANLEMNKRVALEHIIPQRIHPYTDLKNTDPSKYELILKIHKLQKLSINKFQECVGLQKQMSIQDDTIRTLYQMINRREQQKSSDLEMAALKRTLRGKNDEIKALTAEIRMLYYSSNVDAKVAIQNEDELISAKERLSKIRRSKSAKSDASLPKMPSTQNHFKSSRPSAVIDQTLNRNHSNNKLHLPTPSKKKLTRRSVRTDNFN